MAAQLNAYSVTARRELRGQVMEATVGPFQQIALLRVALAKEEQSHVRGVRGRSADAPYSSSHPGAIGGARRTVAQLAPLLDNSRAPFATR
jgi:hypothetical protein